MLDHAPHPRIEAIASYGTRFVVCDIRAWSFTRVNSLRPQS